jgi:hypothetical protein
LELSSPEALPLRPGDRFRIEVRVEPAAYLYVAAIDPDGEVKLFVPASFDQWGQRGEEQPRTTVSLPKNLKNGLGLPKGKKGMVTVLLLARERPWQVEEKRLRALFAGLPEQRPIQSPRSAVWFENWQIVKGDGKRRASSFLEEELGDPVMRTQELLKERLKGEADFTAAVSFAWTE